MGLAGGAVYGPSCLRLRVRIPPGSPLTFSARIARERLAGDPAATYGPRASRWRAPTAPCPARHRIRDERGLHQVPQVPDQPTSRTPGMQSSGDAVHQDDLGSIWQAVTERLRASVSGTTFRPWRRRLCGAAAT